MMLNIALIVIILLELERYRCKENIFIFYNTTIYWYIIYIFNSIIYLIYYNKFKYEINNIDIHKDFTKNHKKIIEELEDALHLYNKINPGIFDSSFEQENDKYGYFFLYYYGKINTNICPTMREIIKKNKKLKTCFISIMDEELYIQEHRGPYAGLLRYHYTLLSSNSEEDFLSLGNNKFFWKEKEGFLFDDTYRHFVEKKTNGMRISIICDFKRDLIFPLNIINTLILNQIPYKDHIKELQIKCIPNRKNKIKIYND